MTDEFLSKKFGTFKVSEVLACIFYLPTWGGCNRVNSQKAFFRKVSI